jgi:hypothetical protein
MLLADTFKLAQVAFDGTRTMALETMRPSRMHVPCFEDALEEIIRTTRAKNAELVKQVTVGPSI